MKILQFLFLSIFSTFVFGQIGVTFTVVNTGVSSGAGNNSSIVSGRNLIGLKGQSTASAGNIFLADGIRIGKYTELTEAYADIKGSPFFREGPLQATIVQNNDVEIPDISILFDTYSNSIIAIKKDESLLILEESYYKEFRVKDDAGEIVFKKLNREDPSKFYQVLYEQDGFVFFKEYEGVLSKGSNLGIMSDPSKFYIKERYFVKEGRKLPKKVKLKEKSFLSALSKSKAKSLKSYIKSNKKRLKSEEDFVHLIQSMEEKK